METTVWTPQKPVETPMKLMTISNVLNCSKVNAQPRPYFKIFLFPLLMLLE